MENFKSFIKTGMVMLVISMFSLGMAAQSTGQWVTKAEKNNMTVSVSLQNCGNGYNVLLYRVQNGSNADRAVSFRVNYNVSGVVINQTKSANVGANSTFSANCNDAAAGVTDAYFLVPGNATVDISRVTVTIL